MSELARFSVSLEADLLERFDHYCSEGKFATRSEAIRQLLREALTDEAVSGPAEDAAGTLTLVYDHHRSGLPEKLLELQHRHGTLIVSTTHVHLDHHLCLEVLILRGQADRIREAAAELRGLKGIRKGQLVLATTPNIP
ncbi:MAG: nickel-responsive transcriptional regulator NikR [Planctomycetia bacterium]|nr:nickel-responsive transcriptional regulator NikR [Planctomycetia bacterium]